MRISTKIGYYIHGITLGLAMIVMIEVSQGLNKMRTIRSDIKKLVDEIHELHGQSSNPQYIKFDVNRPIFTKSTNANEYVVHIITTNDIANVHIYKMIDPHKK